MAVSEQTYALKDEQAGEIWLPLIGNFVGAEHWQGSDSLRTFILASIKDYKGAVVSEDAAELIGFLNHLDVAFNSGLGLLGRRAFMELIQLWSPIAKNPLFDAKHPEWVDKPYYRCQIGSGISQLFTANANCMDTKSVEQWLEQVLMYLSRMIELAPIDPALPGYFFGNTEAASAQNYNLAAALQFAESWMDRWDPETIGEMSAISTEDARNIQVALQRRSKELSVYLD
jgi:hypothetical protein